MPIEVEIKLNIADKTIPQLYTHPLIQQAFKGPTTRRLISTYFDTPDKQLRKAGYALRIRQQDDQYIQTLKGKAATTAGIMARHEWEWPLKNMTLDLTIIPIPELQALFKKRKFLDNFGPVFITEFERTTWDILYENRTTVEIALDQGRIVAGFNSTPIQEVEIELKDGDAEDLHVLAEHLVEDLGLSLDTRSKAARGFALLQNG